MQILVCSPPQFFRVELEIAMAALKFYLIFWVSSITIAIAFPSPSNNEETAAELKIKSQDEGTENALEDQDLEMRKMLRTKHGGTGFDRRREMKG